MPMKLASISTEAQLFASNVTPQQILPNKELRRNGTLFEQPAAPSVVIRKQCTCWARQWSGPDGNIWIWS